MAEPTKVETVVPKLPLWFVALAIATAGVGWWVHRTPGPSHVPGIEEPTK